MTRIVIEAASRRLARCRYCGASIEWASNVATLRMIPFNPPIVFAADLPFEGRPRQRVVDLDRTTIHSRTCPGKRP